MLFIPRYTSTASNGRGLGFDCPDCQIFTGSKPNRACPYHQHALTGDGIHFWRRRPPWIAESMERAFIVALWDQRGWKRPRC